MKALVGAFNQEKTLVGNFSVIVKTSCGTDGALHSTIKDPRYPNTPPPSHYAPLPPPASIPGHLHKCSSSLYLDYSRCLNIRWDYQGREHVAWWGQPGLQINHGLQSRLHYHFISVKQTLFNFTNQIFINRSAPSTSRIVSDNKTIFDIWCIDQDKAVLFAFYWS